MSEVEVCVAFLLSSNDVALNYPLPHIRQWTSAGDGHGWRAGFSHGLPRQLMSGGRQVLPGASEIDFFRAYSQLSLKNFLNLI
jgi:hypothetical protein